MAEPFHEYTRKGLGGIINALPVAVMVVDEHLSVLLANDASLNFTQKNRSELVGLLGGEAINCVNRNAASGGCGFGLNCSTCCLRTTLTDTFQMGSPLKRIETTMAIKTMGERILRFSTLPLKLAGKKAVLLTIEDLTDARIHEQEHLEKEKLAAVLETTGGVCHELGQPLQVIMGYCDILSERKDLDAEARDALVAIGHEVDKLARLTHDLTHVTRYETKPYLTSKIIDIERSSTVSDDDAPPHDKP